MVVLIFSVTTFLPEDDTTAALSTRTVIEAGLKLLTLLMVIITVTPSVITRGVRNPTVLGLLLLGGLFLLSSIWSSDPIRAIGYSVEYLIVIIAGAGLGRYLKENSIALSGWILTSVMITVISYLLVNLITYGEALTFRAFEAQDRSRLIFGGNHPIVTARIVILGLVAILSKHLQNHQLKERIKNAILFLVGFWLVWLTNSRILLGMVTFAVIVVLFLSVKTKWRLLLAAIGAVVISFAALLFVTFSYQQGLSQIDVRELLTFNGRVDIWIAAFSKIHEMPLYGFGYQAHARFLDPSATWANHTHNTFFELLFSLGVIGVGTYFFIFTIILFYLLNFKVSPFVGIWIAIVFIDSFFSVGMTTPSLEPVVFALIGGYGIGNGARNV